MTIKLNHTIVWAHDKEGAARFFAEIFGLRFEGSGGCTGARQRHTDAGLR